MACEDSWGREEDDAPKCSLDRKPPWLGRCLFLKMTPPTLLPRFSSVLAFCPRTAFPPPPQLSILRGRAGTGIQSHCLGMNPGQQEAAALTPRPHHLSPSEGRRQPGCGLPNEDREVVPAVHRCHFPINRGDIPKHDSLQSRHWTGLGHILMAAGPASVCLKYHCP